MDEHSTDRLAVIGRGLLGPAKRDAKEIASLLDDAICVVTSNHIRIGGVMIATAAAMMVVDRASGATLYIAAWKLFQDRCPQAIATECNVPVSAVLGPIIEHEHKYNYFFVDRSNVARKLQSVTEAIAAAATICKDRCYCADPADAKTIYGIPFLPIYDAAEPSPPRTYDIIADVKRHAADAITKKAENC